MPDDLEPEHRISWKAKAAWGGAALLLAGTIALACFWGFSKSAVDAQLAALRARGLPTNGPELNAFYKIPEGTVDSTDLWTAAIAAIEAADVETRGKDLPFVGWGRYPVPLPGETWDQLEAARTFVREVGPALEAIRAAAAAGGQCRFPIDVSAGIVIPLSHLGPMRDTTRLLILDAYVNAHDGNDEQALQDLRAIFAASDALRGEPTAISQLIRVGNHIEGCIGLVALMSRCQWTDAELGSVQSIVRAARFREEMAKGFCGERACSLITIDTVPLGPLHHPNVEEVLGVYERSIEGLAYSWPELQNVQNELDIRHKALNAGLVTRMSLTTALVITSKALAPTNSSVHAEAVQRCTDAAIAARRFQLQYKRWPASLQEIEQSLGDSKAESANRFTDPYNGQPLRFKVEPTQILIYSVFKNGVDDGGKGNPSHPHELLDAGIRFMK